MKVLIRNLGHRIRDLRSKRRWSREQPADGEKNVSFTTIVAVAGGLQITLADLLAGLEQSEGAVAGMIPLSRAIGAGIADGAAAGNRRDRWNFGVDGVVADCDAGGAFLSGGTGVSRQ